MIHVNRGARQAIGARTAAWARAYRNPAIPSDVVTAEAAVWARSVLDEVTRVAAQPRFLASLREPSSGSDSAKLRTALTDLLVSEAVAAVHRRRAFVAPAPAPLPDGADEQRAKRLAMEWMAYLGATEIEPAPDSAAGLDAVSDRFAIRVENWRGDAVDAEQVRAIHDAAAALHRTGIVFSKRGFTSAALDLAGDTEMPLFLLDARRGRLVGANPPATLMRNEGVHARRRRAAAAH